MQAPPLRIGVVLGGTTVSRWAARVLDEIDACPVAEIVGFVHAPEPLPVRESWLFRLYRRLDAHRFASVLNPLEDVDVGARLAGVPEARGVDVDVTIPQWDLDVMLVLEGRAEPLMRNCAAHGAWFYHHGDPRSYRGDPPLFWEIYDGAPISGTVLLRHTADTDTLEVIYESFSATDPISLRRSRARIYAKTAEFVVRKLRDLHHDRELGVVARLDTGQAPMRRAPTNAQMLRFGCRLAVRLGRQQAGKALGHQQWFIAYQRRRSGVPAAETFRGARVLVPPRDRFFADPCLVDWHGACLMFFEEFDVAEGKGVISCCRLMPDGRCSRPQVVLERPYHLSYPFVFFVGDQPFMLPETAQNGSIELYRTDSFPGGWTLDSVLLADIRAVDPTLIERDGRYWLFANVATGAASPNDELFLFSAESLRGPWTSHLRNPVVSDVRSARPAGRPFTDEHGRLVRPSQDCSGRYGSAVVFNRIDELSTERYRETAIGRLEPSWRRSNVGTHTYSRSATWEAVDGRVWRRTFGTRQTD
jgi:hypothetical protein